MDTDYLLTLFAAPSNNESWVIYDIDRVVVTKLTNLTGMNITETNGIHSGKISHNLYKLKHCSKYLSRRILFVSKLNVPKKE